MKQNTEKGFTLLELMIALVLGLIIVAAGISLFLTSQRSLALQQATADIQDNSNFALSYMTRQIRVANLAGTNELPVMSLNTVNSGIVFNQTNLPNVSTTDVSQSGVGPSSINNLQSDQLTIQYRPVTNGGFDCEGRQIPDNFDGYIVERYFVRQDTSILENEPNSLALACKAAYSNNLNELTRNGQIIIKRLDYFRVLVIVSNNQMLQEIPINEYVASGQGQVVGIRLGILSRSTQRVQTQNRLLPSNFSVLDQNVDLPQNQIGQFLREVITQTVAFRNRGGE